MSKARHACVRLPAAVIAAIGAYAIAEARFDAVDLPVSILGAMKTAIPTDLASKHAAADEELLTAYATMCKVLADYRIAITD